MTKDKSDILIGSTPLQREYQYPVGAYVDLQGETYYRVSHYDQMPPFFMSLVSSADHWLFIASTGGLTAGYGGTRHNGCSVWRLSTTWQATLHLAQVNGTDPTSWYRSKIDSQ